MKKGEREFFGYAKKVVIFLGRQILLSDPPPQSLKLVSGAPWDVYRSYKLIQITHHAQGVCGGVVVALVGEREFKLKPTP